MSEDQARRVGALAGKTANDDIVDVTVVEGAARRRDAVVTSNDAHMRTIAEAAGARLHIEHVPYMSDENAALEPALPDGLAASPAERCGTVLRRRKYRYCRDVATAR